MIKKLNKNVLVFYKKSLKRSSLKIFSNCFRKLMEINYVRCKMLQTDY